MSWRGIIIGAIAGFAWLLLIRSLLVAGVISASTTGANWLTLGGLAVVWLVVALLANRSNNENAD